MWRRRNRNRGANGSRVEGSQAAASTTPAVAPVRPPRTATPGVQIFGENYLGPQLLEETDFHRSMDKNSRINLCLNSIRAQNIRDPLEKLKVQLKDLDEAFQDGTLDQFEFEEARRKACEDAKRSLTEKKLIKQRPRGDTTTSSLLTTGRNSAKYSSTVAVSPEVELQLIQEAEDEVNNNEEVQELLNARLNDLNLPKPTATVAAALVAKTSINQTDQVLVDVLAEEQEQEEPELVAATSDSQNQGVQENHPSNHNGDVVSAFLYPDDENSPGTIVLGEGDFVIHIDGSEQGERADSNVQLAVAMEDDDSAPQAQAFVEATVEEPEEVIAQVEEPEEVVAQVEEEAPETEMPLRGQGSFFLLEEDSEQDQYDVGENANLDDLEALEMLMGEMGTGEPPKPVKKENSQETLERQQAADFQFKHENPPGRARDIEVSTAVKSLHVEEAAEEPNEEFNETENTVEETKPVEQTADAEEPEIPANEPEEPEPIPEAATRKVSVEPPAEVSPTPLLQTSAPMMFLGSDSVENEEEEEKAPTPALQASGPMMFLGLGAEDNDDEEESKGVDVSEEDALMMLMGEVESPKKKSVKVKKVAPQLKQKPKKPVVNNLKPKKEASTGIKPLMMETEKKKPKKYPAKKVPFEPPAPVLKYKPSKQAMLDESEVAAFDRLMDDSTPRRQKSVPHTEQHQMVINNNVTLFNEDDEDSEDGVMAGPVKPLFITTADQFTLKEPTTKPIKSFYPDPDKSSSFNPTPIAKPTPRIGINSATGPARGNLVHGLLGKMTEEGKTPQEMLDSMQDLVNIGTLSADELELARTILQKTGRL